MHSALHGKSAPADFNVSAAASLALDVDAGWLAEFALASNGRPFSQHTGQLVEAADLRVR